MFVGPVCRALEARLSAFFFRGTGVPNEVPRTSTTFDRRTGMRLAIAACWLSACSACLLHGRRAAVRPRVASRLMATANADLELEMAWCARVVREAADMLVKGCVDTCS